MKYDIMLGGRFLCTISYPAGLPIGYEGDEPVFFVDQKKIKQFIEKKRPSLKGKNYRILPVEKEVKDLWLR